MRTTIGTALLTGAAVLLLSGCGETPPATNTAKTAAAPDKLPAGEYEVTAKVASLRSTDGKTPLTKLKQGESVTTKGCVDDKGTPAPELFAAAGDQCTPQNPYLSGGVVNVTLSCARKGVAGKIMVNVDGATTAEGLKGNATTTTFIDGSGDYELRTDFTGKRIGACTAAPKA